MRLEVPAAGGTGRDENGICRFRGGWYDLAPRRKSAGGLAHFSVQFGSKNVPIPFRREGRERLQSEGCHYRRRCHEDKDCLVGCCFLGGVSVVVAGGGWGSENRHRRGCAHLRPALLLPPPLLLSLLRLSVPVPGIRGASGGLLSPAGLCAGPGLHSSGNGATGAGRNNSITIRCRRARPRRQCLPRPLPRAFCPAPATAPMPPAASPPPVPQPSGTN